MPAVSWPSEASFSRLHQAILRGAQVLERGGQFARARLHLVEQAHVLDRDHRLVGEGLDQLDLLVGERPHGFTLQNDHPDGDSFAQQRDSQASCEHRQLLLRRSF